jgi:hypothetical protein
MPTRQVGVRAALALGLSIVVVVSAACSDDENASADPPTSPTPPTTTIPAPTATAPPTAPPTEPASAPTTAPVLPVVDWNDPSGYRAEIDGWTLAGCGEAPILCVSRSSGSGSGSVEVVTFPADSFDVIAGPLADGDLDAALAALVADYHDSFSADREQTCPPAFTYTPLPSVPSTVGGAAGLRYGFEVRDGNGAVVERSVSYNTLDTNRLVIISAAALDADRGCLEPIGEFAVDDLVAFEPVFDALVTNSRLP